MKVQLIRERVREERETRGEKGRYEIVSLLHRTNVFEKKRKLLKARWEKTVRQTCTQTT